MSELWITLNDIPEEGQNFVFEDQNFWSAAWKQYKVDVRPGDALVSEVYVLPQDKGCLVRGGTEGSVTIACDRCTADYKHNISTEFEEYEQVAEDGDDEPSPVVKTKEGLKSISVPSSGAFCNALPIKPFAMKNAKDFAASAEPT